MSDVIERARNMIVKFKGERYAFGTGVLDAAGPMTAQVGKEALLVGRITSSWLKPALDQVLNSLKANGVVVLDQVQGAAPNAPREDVYRIHGHILHERPDVIVSLESGSGIDACKAAATLVTFGDVEAELDTKEIGSVRVSQTQFLIKTGMLHITSCNYIIFSLVNPPSI